MTFSPHTIRQQFPILDRKIGDHPLVYLDNAATTQKPYSVLGKLEHYYHNQNANIHRGVHTLAEEATEAYEQARTTTATFINAPHTEEVIFTRNTTESINLFAYSWGHQNLKAGDEIILSEMEHHSNLVPWQLLAQHTGAILRFIPITETGTLDYPTYEQILSPKTKLVSITHISNVLGTTNDIPRIIAGAHSVGARVLIDAAQSIAHLPIDVTKLNCDAIAFSGHKMYAPLGIGILWAKRDLLETMPPFLGGGEMIRTVTLQAATWNDIPHKFEAGTPHIAGAIGLGAAITFLNDIGTTTIATHEQKITTYAHQQLTQLPQLTIYGPPPTERGAVIAFTHRDIHPHDLAALLDTESGIAVRAGHHCCMPLAKRLNVSATCRASFAIYTTKEEIDTFITAIEKAEDIMQCRDCNKEKRPCCPLR